ncbi:hypothetical protein NQK81_13375 [Amycolatopsis roodepoortensis]|uniref:hypothetical protein n=1 Tax=Amycolatopsis roodepoortensis TaxID=700274 RepID=UPI00214C7364|nr:hypothetical protein [Amycolatopsis roodepoortensis]UUV34396.1 hypothetical protein NQK81_13375 [Amycolatopsis roodepoortensis]
MNLCRCGKPARDSTLCPDCVRQVVTDLRALATGGVLRIRVHQKRIPVPAVVTLLPVAEVVTPATFRVVDELHTDTRPSLYELLVDTLVRRDHTGSDSIGAVSGAAAFEVDFHAAASELKAAIDGVIRTWAVDVAERHGRELPARSVRKAAAWLAANPALLAAHPDAGDFADQITKLTRSALRVIDRDPEKVYLGQCGAKVIVDKAIGSCEADIYAPPGRPVVQCRKCGAIWDVPERREFLLAAVDDQLATPPEISKALTRLGREVTESMIYGYVHRGRLNPHPPHPHDSRGRARYRVGDVRAIVDALTQQEG